MSQKCQSCGLVNWANAPECKRCKAPLQPLESSGATELTMPVFEQKKPATALGVLMIIWGVLMSAAGLFILSFGPVSHVLVLGPAIIISGIFVMRGRQRPTVLYFLGVLVMLFWVSAEGKAFLGIGGALFAGLIGLLITKRRFPILAGFLIVFSCLAIIGAMLLPTLMMPAKVGWRNFQPPQGSFTLQMPSEPIARQTKVEHLNGYTLTKHIYESRVRGQGAALYVVVEFTPALSLSEPSFYEKILDAELTALLNTTNSTLVSKYKEVAFSDCLGIRYEVKPPANLDLEKPRSLGRIFMNSDHLYLMHFTASERSELMANSAYFLNPVPSNQLVGAQAQR
jgi:hypothetical protein